MPSYRQSDNEKRQPLWRQGGGYNSSAPLYRWTQLAVAARSSMLASLSDTDLDRNTISHLHSEEDFLSFQRGNAVVVIVSNTSNDNAKFIRVNTSLPAGAFLCDALRGTTRGQDSLSPTNDTGCISILHGGALVTPVNGLPRIFLPAVPKSNAQGPQPQHAPVSAAFAA